MSKLQVSVCVISFHEERSHVLWPNAHSSTIYNSQDMEAT